MMDARQQLYDAALTGETHSLLNLLKADKLILDRCISEGRYTKSPLHVAVNAGHLEFTTELLCRKPELAEEVDQVKMWSPLHMASAKGHLEIVKSLINVSPSMCLARDQDGLTPIHVAAARGHVSVLEELHHANRCAAQEVTNNGESVLHLCVKHRQLDAFKSLINLNKDDGDQLIKSKDNNGNTILHLAVTCKQREMVRYLVEDCKSSIEINAVNNKNMTVVDLHNNQLEKGLGDIRIHGYLTSGKAKEAMDLAERFENERSALMVVASLLATMAFQVGTNPPGGVYQDTIKGDHQAGLAIWSYRMYIFYRVAESISTVAFVSSMTVILILISGVSFTRQYTVAVRIILMIATISTWGIFCVVSVRLSIHGKDRDGAVMFLALFSLYVFLAIYLLHMTFEISVRRYCKNGFNWLQDQHQKILSLNRGEAGQPQNADA